jgi:uncharacterized protein involved in exopolysaccharide biosynthesis
VSLLWAVPVAAAAVACALGAARARAIEEAARDLAREVRGLAALRGPLAEIRHSTADTESLVAEFRAAHEPADPGEGGGTGRRPL